MARELRVIRASNVVLVENLPWVEDEELISYLWRTYDFMHPPDDPIPDLLVIYPFCIQDDRGVEHKALLCYNDPLCVTLLFQRFGNAHQEQKLSRNVLHYLHYPETVDALSKAGFRVVVDVSQDILNANESVVFQEAGLLQLINDLDTFRSRLWSEMQTFGRTTGEDPAIWERQLDIHTGRPGPSIVHM